ncbi:MAG: nucleotidyltransferase substrate binding protein [Pseudanabaena sp. CAN_BIN31]|nr:nucleotidyltransferase substrate binding protein [Pseudanabaena sp. CAN_BIN31]
MEDDTRWIQRFSNFERAFLLLQSALKIEHPSIIERAGLIQFFEMSFELSWKLLKDYEEAEGFIIKTPREAIKQAFQSGLISNGHEWIDALQDRNLTAHTYNENTAIAVEAKIRDKYFQLLLEIYEYFQNKIKIL